MRKQEPINTQTDYLQKLGYETSDVALFTLARWIVYLFIFIGTVSVATLGFYLLFVGQATTTPFGAPPTVGRRLPKEPNPTVQAHPIRDIQEFRQGEKEKLDGAIWIDRNKGIVSIPVNRAMDLVLQRGLPARGEEQPQSAEPAIRSGRPEGPSAAERANQPIDRPVPGTQSPRP